jgi:hypothetical protein
MVEATHFFPWAAKWWIGHVAADMMPPMRHPVMINGIFYILGGADTKEK